MTSCSQNDTELMGAVMERQVKEQVREEIAMASNNDLIEDIVSDNVEKAASAVVAVNMYLTTQVSRCVMVLRSRCRKWSKITSFAFKDT